MELPVGYLSVEPHLWEQREDYKQAKEIVKSLQVVNDNAMTMIHNSWWNAATVSIASCWRSSEHVPW